MNFLLRLFKNNIEEVIDVRSKPFSQDENFIKWNLKRRLKENGIDYQRMGKSLGGLEDVEKEFYEASLEKLISYQI